jgi:hypothetical protein
MSASIPSLPPEVSRNAHILYRAQRSGAELKVDKNGNLQRVGPWGRFFAKIADVFTHGKFGASRAAEVMYIAGRTFEDIDLCLQQVEDGIKEKKIDVSDEKTKSQIKALLNLTPPRRPFYVEGPRIEPIYYINTRGLPQSERVYVPNSETDGTIDRALGEIAKKFAKKETEPFPVSQARVFVNSLDLFEKIGESQIPENISGPETTPLETAHYLSLKSTLSSCQRTLEEWDAINKQVDWS